MADTQAFVNGTYDAATGTVRGLIPQDSIDRRITAITIRGPQRSTFKVYKGSSAVDANLITSTPTGGGGDNSYDSTTDGAPNLIPAATDCLCVWSGGATAVGSTGQATVRMVY
jgi:hypothetical protein